MVVLKIKVLLAFLLRLGGTAQIFGRVDGSPTSGDPPTSIPLPALKLTSVLTPSNLCLRSNNVFTIRLIISSLPFPEILLLVLRVHRLL